MAGLLASLHLHPPGPELPLVVVLVAAAIGGVLLLGLALAAYRQRRSRSYLLIALAIAALFTRTMVASLSMIDLLPGTEHHLLEHALDIAMIAFVIGAVYYARDGERRVERGEDG